MTNAIEHIDAIKSKIHTVRGQRVMLGDGGLLGSYAMRYRAALLVPCGGAFFIASPLAASAVAH